MTTSTRGTLLIGVLALVWGSNFLWIKIALDAFSPIQLTFARMVLGALVLLAVITIRRDKLPRDLPTWGHLFVAALVANAAPYLLFALGETRVDSGIAGALNATTPLWTLGLGFAVRQSSRLNAFQVTGLGLGFAGSLLIFTPWDAGTVDTLGALHCLLAALSYGISYLYMSRYLTPRKLTPTVLSTSQLVAASSLTALTLPFDTAGAPQWSWVPWLGLAILGVIGTGLAYIINYALIRIEGPVGASVVTYLVPVASVTFGFAFLNESVPLLSLSGVAVILLGVWASRQRMWSPRNSIRERARPEGRHLLRGGNRTRRRWLGSGIGRLAMRRPANRSTHRRWSRSR
ncbi:MAG: EamA family transporter [Actinophytocola sp.]|uniref:DMT family transporter n=1 Tax=Actinophytocola sp. TaxID=1872138 RepID=UPI00132060EC|nr:DMT family transporter [Actinophytocola sp.]MPZ83168.1 EamA family transporter [Actinophytocola sp.]